MLLGQQENTKQIKPFGLCWICQHQAPFYIRKGNKRACFGRDFWKNLSDRSIKVSSACGSYEAGASPTCTGFGMVTSRTGPFHLTMCCGHQRHKNSPAPQCPRQACGIIISKYVFQTPVLLKALLLELASGWVAWLVKGCHLRNNMLRKRPGKKLSQPIYGSDSKLCSKPRLNKLRNLFLLLIDGCPLRITILSFSLNLLCCISENPFSAWK